MASWEAERDDRVATRHAEIKGEYVFDAPEGPFKLIGRADRIDVFRDGSVGIYDYKTGAPPSPKQVLLFSPQLALEGAMVTAGAFGAAFAGRSLSEMAWIALGKAGSRENPVRSAVDDGSPDAVAAEALAMLRGLLARYDDPAHGYASQARPMFERRFPGDYDHLARVSEWRLVAAPGGTP
jgi:ATP-dependent helicase/nuclease subunit B